MARAICRRAERTMSILLRDGDIADAVYQYVNRLSDFLYNVSLYVSMREGITPKKWVKVDYGVCCRTTRL